MYVYGSYRTQPSSAGGNHSVRESALTHLLPVVDDFERALQNIRSAEDIKAVTEGPPFLISSDFSRNVRLR